jgi:hypothetical protein
MKNLLFLITLLFAINTQSFSQHLAMTFQESSGQGIQMTRLDSIYKNAVNADPSKAVFKTESEQTALQESYYTLLKDLGQFLADNKFNWDKPTNCFNKIYFSADGTIDYFLFNFLGKPDNRPTEAQQLEFKRLLNLFITDYKFPLAATVKFSQCSPSTFMPGK